MVHVHGWYSIKGLSTGGVHTRIQTRQFQAMTRKKREIGKRSSPQRLLSAKTPHKACGSGIFPKKTNFFTKSTFSINYRYNILLFTKITNLTFSINRICLFPFLLIIAGSNVMCWLYAIMTRLTLQSFKWYFSVLQHADILNRLKICSND